MVTFVCYHCDKTLKKKQADSHNCRPSAYICIDCHVTFNNGDHKAHTACLTEQEKHWGEFAKKKGPKQQPVQTQQQQPTAKSQQPKPQPKNGVDKQSKQKHADADNQSVEAWKGWKNEIKRIIRQKGQVELGTLKVTAIKRFRQCGFEEEGNQEQILEQKVRKLKNVCIKTTVSLKSE